MSAGDADPPDDRSLADTVEQPVRVLHVDDEPGLLELVATHLEREGDRLAVVGETSAEDALERLDRERVDCVVSDYDMPGTDGLALLRRVREDHGDLPFLLFTGKGGEGVASEAISAGVTDYLQKGTGTEQYALLANRIENAVVQHRAEQQVRQGFRALATAREGISIIDADGRFRYVNDAYLDVVGYSRERLVGSHWELLFPEEHVEDVYEHVLTAVPEEGRWTGETVYERPDGERVLVDHALARTDDGGLVCLVRDRSDGGGRDGPLVAEDAFVDRLLDALDDVFYVLDLEGNVLRVNDVATDVTGYSGDELTSMAATDLVAPDDRAAVAEDTRRAVEEGGASVEADLLRRDGTTVAYEFRKRAVTVDGEVVALVGIGRDVSEQRRRERQLRRQSKQFEQFGAVLRHDLMNPLNVATGNLEVAAEDGDPDAVAEAAAALDRLEGLVEDLAAVMAEGSLVGDVEPVDVGAVARDCWAALGTDSGALSVADAPTVAGDPEALARLFDNLLRNSVEHAGADVTVEVGRLPDGFYVADDGPGISADESEAVFEPGYTTKDEGSGLGMASARQIVLAHGWEITAGESEQGGARFDVTDVDVVE